MPMLNNTLSDAVFYTESTYLRVMLALHTPVLGVALILLLILHLNRQKFVAHQSLTVLLHCHMFWTFMLCFITFVDHARIISILFIGSPIDLVSTYNFCLLKTAPQCLAIYGSVSSMFMMSFERYTASTALSTYEKSCTSYGYKLAVGHLLIAIPFTTLMTLTYGNVGRETSYCNVNTPKGEHVHQILAVVLIVQEAWTIVMFKRLLKMNETRLKSTSSFTLTERYQISENIRMLRIMLPVVWSHVLITVIAAPIFVIATLIAMSERYFPLFEDSINVLFLQGIFMPLFFLRQFRLDASRNREMMETNTATGEALRTAHRAAVQSSWNVS